MDCTCGLMLFWILLGDVLIEAGKSQQEPKVPRNYKTVLRPEGETTYCGNFAGQGNSVHKGKPTKHRWWSLTGVSNVSKSIAASLGVSAMLTHITAV